MHEGCSEGGWKVNFQPGARTRGRGASAGSPATVGVAATVKVVGVALAAVLGAAIAAGAGAGGCACQRTIGLTGSGDADGETDTGWNDGAIDGSDEGETHVSWDPPIENMGEPGWGESASHPCVGRWENTEGIGVFSDPEGVLLLIDGNRFVSEVPPFGRTLVLANGGAGWSVLFEENGETPSPNCFHGIVRVPGVAAWTWGPDNTGCSTLEITGLGETSREEFAARHAFVAAPGAAYMVSGTSVLRRDAGGWTTMEDTGPVLATCIWASADSDVVLGSDGGYVLMLEESGTWRASDTGSGVPITAIWSFGPGDIWAGTSGGNLLHYDGEAWSGVEWPREVTCTGDQSIRGMWGEDGVLFFHDQSQIAVMDSGVFRLILVRNCLPGEMSVESLWGNSRNEVFVAVRDPRSGTEDCDPVFVMWWDGAEFHWF